MQCGIFGIPFRAVEVIAVLGQRCQVDNTKHAAVIWPRIGVVRCRFAEVVETGPHKLAYHPWQIIVGCEIQVGDVRPIAVFCVVRRTLMIIVHSSIFLLHREHIHSARRHGRSCFRAQNYVLRQFFVGFFIAFHLVVESGDVESGGKAVGGYCIKLVHTACHGASWVFAMAYILKEIEFAHSVGTPLARHFVAYTPHHHRGIVAIVMKHIHHVALCPLGKYRPVAVAALGAECPVVEGLYHHHKAHLIAQLHEFGRRHVMRCAYGVAAHILEHLELMAYCRAVHGSSQRTEVVVIAHTAKFGHFAIKEKAFFGHKFYGAYAYAGAVAVAFLAVLEQAGHHCVEIWCFGCP